MASLGDPENGASLSRLAADPGCTAPGVSGSRCGGSAGSAAATGCEPVGECWAAALWALAGGSVLVAGAAWVAVGSAVAGSLGVGEVLALGLACLVMPAAVAVGLVVDDGREARAQRRARATAALDRERAAAVAELDRCVPGWDGSIAGRCWGARFSDSEGVRR